MRLWSQDVRVFVSHDENIRSFRQDPAPLPLDGWTVSDPGRPDSFERALLKACSLAFGPQNARASNVHYVTVGQARSLAPLPAAREAEGGSGSSGPHRHPLLSIPSEERDPLGVWPSDGTVTTIEMASCAPAACQAPS